MVLILLSYLLNRVRINSVRTCMYSTAINPTIYVRDTHFLLKTKKKLYRSVINDELMMFRYLFHGDLELYPT